VVVGSSPIGHPKKTPQARGFHLQRFRLAAEFRPLLLD
jgi:hypothetical protein